MSDKLTKISHQQRLEEKRKKHRADVAKILKKYGAVKARRGKPSQDVTSMITTPEAIEKRCAVLKFFIKFLSRRHKICNVNLFSRDADRYLSGKKFLICLKNKTPILLQTLRTICREGILSQLCRPAGLAKEFIEGIPFPNAPNTFRIDYDKATPEEQMLLVTFFICQIHVYRKK